MRTEYLIIIIIFISCTKELEVELKHSSKDVINMVIKSSEIDLSIFESKSILDTLSFEPVCNAVGVLKHNSLTYEILNDNCNYYLTDSLFFANKEVEMEIEIEGKKYNSMLTYPEEIGLSVNVLEVKYIESISQPQLNGNGEIEYYITNIYEIESEIKPTQQFIYNKFIGYSMEYYINSEINYASSDFTNATSVRNNWFLNEIKTISARALDFNSIKIKSAILVADSIANIDVIQSVFLLDENLHTYLISGIKNIESMEPFTTPAKPFSNISGDAFGVFGAYRNQSIKKSIQLPN